MAFYGMLFALSIGKASEDSIGVDFMDCMGMAYHGNQYWLCAVWTCNWQVKCLYSLASSGAAAIRGWRQLVDFSSGTVAACLVYMNGYGNFFPASIMCYPTLVLIRP